MIRVFDFIFSLLGLIFLSPIFFILFILGWWDTGSPLFIQQRVGKGKSPFILVKFRTMRKDTPSIASHLADKSSITRLGIFLRRSKLDELPQLWNVLVGDMSLVGPRPCLFNQKDLINERNRRGIYNFRPGITGLAQIKNIDMSTPELLASTEQEMLRDFSLPSYFWYIFRTVVGSGVGDAINK